ncbi:MAG: tetratricopeptide repeat protein [Candidatus Thiodiazotropha sp.]
MEALISGTARLAALIDGNKASLLDDQGNVLRISKQSDIARQFYLYDDTISLNNIEKPEVLKTLRIESERSDLLLLILTILDQQIDDSSKTDLYSIAESYLNNNLNLNYIRGILYSKPLPINAIKNLPNNLHESQDHLYHLIEDLLDSQNFLDAFHTYWRELISKFKLDNKDVALMEGTFTNLAVAFHLSRDTLPSNIYSNLKFECLANLHQISNGRRVILDIFNSYNNVKEEEKIHWPGDYKEITKETFQRKRSKETIHDVFEQVNSQIKRISDFLNSGDTSHAEQFAKELISFQLSRGDNAYAAMSLCKLSEEAKNAGLYDLQLAWAQKAVATEPADGRSYGHVADAYMNLWHLDDARIWFEKCIDVGDPGYGMSGLARIERALFNYDEALKLINISIEQGQATSHTYNIKAEILRDLGRLDESVGLYENLVKKFPEDSVSMCGLASAKTEQKEYKEAELIYRNAIDLYQNEQVPFTGLGFLLARQGNFKEAFEFLDQGIKLSKFHSPIPLMAKASALRMSGQFSEAIEVFSEINSKFPFFRDSRFELIDTLGQQRKLDRAYEALEEAKESYGNDSTFLFAESLLHQYNGDLVPALQILDTVKRLSPRWIRSLLTRAKVLKQLSEFDESRKQYEEILAIHPNERHATLGLEIIHTLIGSSKSIKPEITPNDNEAGDNVFTYDDWSELNIRGLLLLSNKHTDDASRIFSSGSKNSPFPVLKRDFALSLMLIKTKLGKHKASLKHSKKIKTEFGLIQQSISYGEQGQLAKAKETLTDVPKRPDINNLISLVSRRYSEASKDATIPTIDEILDAQVEAMLLAA